MAIVPTFRNHLKAFGVGLVLAALGIFAYVQFGPSDGRAAAADLPAVTVYKSPTCGCCAKWVDHLREEGFSVQTSDVMDLQNIKQRFNVPTELSSCHTAVVGGYVVEGHVPADDVKRLLQEKPDVAGLSVPGMPVGSPGMEQGDRLDPYNVLTFTKEGDANIYTRYGQ